MAEYLEQEEVQTRLEAMGLSIEALKRVVVSAAGAFNSTTRFHPSSAAGTYMYQEGTAALRRACVPLGYDFDEDGHQPRTFSEERGVSIILQTGDDNTGVLTGVEPTARNPKGTATKNKVSSNYAQMSLFNLATPESPDTDMYNWVLLVAVVDDVVRAELSLPREVNSEGKPCGWVERILLPEEPLARDLATDEQPHKGDSDRATDDVEIDVKWKK